MNEMNWIRLAVVACFALACSTGCDRFLRSEGSSESAPGAAPNAARTAFDLQAGEQSFTFTPAGDGYTFASGRVKIESDRIKLDGPTATKVKLKDYGFKLYDANETELLKGKRRGAGWKIQRADGSELGKLDENGGTLGSSNVAVSREGERWKVTRDGQVVGSASASLPPAAAALLGVTEVSSEQRLALVIFHKEIVR